MSKDYRKNYLSRLQSGGIIYEAELLAIILGNAYGGKDMSREAHSLLQRFPSIRAVIEADMGEITAVEGVTPNIATYLKTLGLVVKSNSQDATHIRNSMQCRDFAFERFKGKDSEIMEVYLVNKSGKIVHVRTFTSGKANRVEVAANSVYSIISTVPAYGLYFAHNHVNMPAEPSAHDDWATYKILFACNACGIKFLDHCIVSSNGDWFSYAESGRMNELK